MYKLLLRQQRLYLRCSSSSRRNLSFLSTGFRETSTQQHDFPPPIYSDAGAQIDDRTLREVFDSTSFWKQFSTHETFRSASQGLFRNRYLTGPAGFREFADRTLEKAQRIVAKVVSASEVAEYRTIVRDLDQLSDLICRVIDLSDFVRGTHPDQTIQDAANQAFTKMLNYMNVLNTTSKLRDQLQYAVRTPEISKSWSEEEQTVADILLRDFSKSAIELDEGKKRDFIDRSDDVSRWGTQFVEKMQAETPSLTFASERLKGVDPLILRKYQKFGRLNVSTLGPLSTTILRTAESEAVRKQVYLAGRRASPMQISRLENMLHARAELARLGGFSSFAHMTLQEKMVKSPEAVQQFLAALKKDNLPRLSSEIDQMAILKRAQSSEQDVAPLQIWDKDYFTRQILKARQRQSPISRASETLNVFFSIGTVIQGLSRLFQRLYGMRLVPRPNAPGETWHPEVRRLDVVDERDGHVAVLYCDLFERVGKNPNPAHFTIRCSRRLSEAEIQNQRNDSRFASAEEAANDGMSFSRNSAGEIYQLPTIALICDFQRGSGLEPTLLSFREVQTLFHEMGHAVHSMIGRTALQNVSGTRCATDFAELPSVLMESFASDPTVLGLFARHWKSDDPLPFDLVQRRVELDQFSEGCETESQILMAMLDQALHSEAALSDSFDSTSVYQAVFNGNSTLREPPTTNWQGFFGHLFGYGATYYSYLFDRAIAGKIWRHVFQKTPQQPTSREAGELFKSEVLRWGGGRDPWKCIAGVLDRPDLAEGGAAAVAEVGSWGVMSRKSGSRG